MGCLRGENDDRGGELRVFELLEVGFHGRGGVLLCLEDHALALDAAVEPAGIAEFLLFDR